MKYDDKCMACDLVQQRLIQQMLWPILYQQPSTHMENLKTVWKLSENYQFPNTFQTIFRFSMVVDRCWCKLGHISCWMILCWTKSNYLDRLRLSTRICDIGRSNHYNKSYIACRSTSTRHHFAMKGLHFVSIALQASPKELVFAIKFRTFAMVLGLPSIVVVLFAACCNS